MGQAGNGAALNMSRGAWRAAKLRKHKGRFLGVVEQALGPAFQKVL